MKKIVVLGLFMILLTFSFLTVGCGNRSPLIGKWEWQSGNWIYFFCDSEIIEFKTDGTVIVHDEEEIGNWTVFGDDRLRVDSDGYGDNFTFSINNNILTIVDEDGVAGRWRKAR